MFDGVAFFVIMVIASLLVFLSSTIAVQERELVSRRDRIVLVHEARDAILSATVPVANYTDDNGVLVPLYNHTILDLFIVELSLIGDGLNREQFDEEGGVNEAITRTSERVLGGMGFHHAWFATHGQCEVELLPEGIEDRASIPLYRITSGVTISMSVVGKEGSATVELWVWV